MIENQNLIERLRVLLTQKQSRKYYAMRLGITEGEVNALLNEIKGSHIQNRESATYIAELEDVITSFEEDLKNQKASLTANFRDQIKTLDELVTKCKIDTKIWNIDKYIQNAWGSAEEPHWQVKAWLSRKSSSEIQKSTFQKNFINFLETYKPLFLVAQAPSFLPNQRAPEACLIINKQDEHANKYDIGGENNIDKRFNNTYNKLELLLRQADIANEITEIYYVIGSDQFNSEWTGATTRGTKQENLLPYQEGFTKICEYELKMIGLLQAFCNKLNIIFVSGNHDEYVGWHLATWLQAFFRDNPKINFDTSSRYRKYVKYGKNAVMFNHGDAIKPEKLASMFPIEFKDRWSLCENYYIFTGDKHHEISKDLGGIKFYQLPALSKAKSLWDDKMGHTCSKAEFTAFVIDKNAGVTAILKQPI